MASLDGLLAETVRHLDDEIRTVSISRRFHEQIVAGCGNQTLITVIGALEVLWSAHQLEWADRMETSFEIPRRRTGVKEHEQIVAAIRSGDPSRAHRVMTRHLAKSYVIPARVEAELRLQRPSAPRSNSLPPGRPFS